MCELSKTEVNLEKSKDGLIKAEKRLEQAQHRYEREEKRAEYLGQKKRKERTHRLITRGAAVESIYKDVEELTEQEFYELMETIFEENIVRSLAAVAVENHRKAVMINGTI